MTSGTSLSLLHCLPSLTNLQLSYLLLFPVLLAIYRLYFHPLSHVPGPRLAAITRFNLLATFLRGRQHHEYLALHDKYGPVVRIAPNTVIFDNPTGTKEKAYFDWDKSDWWRAFRIDPEQIPHGNEQDSKLHAAKKKLVMGGYSMSRVLANEAAMDVIISQFIEQMRAKSRTGEVFDLAPWMQYVGFDVAMEMTFSNPVGFVKAGADVSGLISSLHVLILGGGSAALFPIIPKILQWKWWWKWFEPNVKAKSGPGRVRGLAYEQVGKRFAEEDRGKGRYNDILQWIVDREGKEGQRMSQVMLEQEAVSPVLAGSDTTAGVMRSVVLHVASRTRVLSKLQHEIDEADKTASLGQGVVSWECVKRHVPYVEAVCREGLRMFPVVGFPLFRVVPEGGAEVQGLWLPAGTEIGFSQWVVSRNKAVWGDDANIFRPERWLEKLDVEKRRLRDAGEVFFGSGGRMCTGRHVATVEMYKIVCEFFRRFDVEVVDSMQPWKLRNLGAIVHWDFWVRLVERRNGNGLDADEPTREDE